VGHEDIDGDPYVVAGCDVGFAASAGEKFFGKRHGMCMKKGAHNGVRVAAVQM
jgi:hypothetical protein